MRLIQHYSSSAGNLYEVIAGNGKRLLLDPGVTWAKIQKAIKFDLSNIEGVLVSHAHKDHLKEPDKLLQNALDIYASKETFEANGLLDNRRCHVVEDKQRFKISDTFEVFPFALPHDCEGTMGFIVKDKSSWLHRPGYIDKCVPEYLLFVPDTMYIEQKFALPFNIIALECNFDEDVLQTRVNTGDINEELAKRIRQSHMSKQACFEYIEKFCNISKCTEIHLLHMSGDNINKKESQEECQKKFFIKTVICKRK